MVRHFIAAALMCLAACATPPQPSAFSAAGVSWIRIDDENANPHGATISFDDGKNAWGDTGCGRWGAPIVVEGERLRFLSVALPRMACGAEVQAATQHNFLSALERTRTYRLDGEDLVFADDAGAVVARFTCAQEPCPHAP